MTSDEMSFDSMMAEATRLGEEQKKLEKRNKQRKAKGRPPLPDRIERLDAEAMRVKHMTGSMTVDGAEALRLFEKRRAAMMGDVDPEDEIDTPDKEVVDPEPELDNTPSASPIQEPDVEAEKHNADFERAQKEAEAARRVADMKNGRINHESVWSDGGQKLERGDDTNLRGTPEKKAEPEKVEMDKKPAKRAKKTSVDCLSSEDFKAFKDDLYYRLKESFAGLELTLSDLQGRVSEIVTASASSLSLVQKQDDGGPGKNESFSEMLSKKIPVSFNVDGTTMSFDAITVFHASPCITIVSNMGSATIRPKPGARLKMSYTMDGADYIDDPVTYLGTRFELPMFGLAFIGFIRDLEAGDLEA